MNKLYGRVLIKKIRDLTDGAISDGQCGFRSCRGYAVYIFTVRHLCMKYFATGRNVFLSFTDLENAYDRVDSVAFV